MILTKGKHMTTLYEIREKTNDTFGFGAVIADGHDLKKVKQKAAEYFELQGEDKYYEFSVTVVLVTSTDKEEFIEDIELACCCDNSGRDDTRFDYNVAIGAI